MWDLFDSGTHRASFLLRVLHTSLPPFAAIHMEKRGVLIILGWLDGLFASTLASDCTLLLPPWTFACTVLTGSLALLYLFCYLLLTLSLSKHVASTCALDMLHGIDANEEMEMGSTV